MKNVIDFLIEHWKEGIGLSAIILEILLRLFPTKKDWSLVNKIFAILNVIIPNLERGADGKIKRKRIAKIVIFFALCVNLGNYVNAQNPVNVFGRGIYSYNTTDTVTLQNARTTLQNNQGNTGVIYFDKTRNKWRGWDGSAYADLFGQGDTFNFDSLPFVTPEHYGAVGDGVTNDATAIQSAVNSGKPVWFGQKNYRITSGINVPINSKLIGSGKGSIISITTGITILTLNGNTLVDNLTFDGTDAASQIGIRVSDAVAATSTKISNIISNCIFIDLNYGLNASNVYGVSYEGAYYVESCYFTSNNIGVYLEASAEYNNFVNCVSYANTTGVRFDANNNQWNGGHVTANTTGFFMSNTSSKWIVNGVHINHNTTALNDNSQGAAGQHTFSDNHVFGGNMILNGATDGRFLGNTFSDAAPTNWTFTNQSRCVFSENNFVYTPTISLTGTYPTFFNNSWVAGIATYAENNITGKLNLIPSATLAGLNAGSLAGDPSALINGDIWYNSTTGNLRARIAGSSVSLGIGTIAGTLSSPQIAYGSAANTIKGEAGFEYNETTNFLSTPNITVSNNLYNSALTSGRIPIVTTSGLITDDNGLTYDAIGNTLTSENSVVTTNLTLSSIASGRIPYTTTAGLITSDAELTFTNAGDGQITIGSTNQAFLSASAVGGTGTQDFNLSNGTVASGTAFDVNITSGQSSSGQGGDVNIKASSGTTQNGNIVLDIATGASSNGWVVITTLPVNCVGAPTGALWNNAGVLNVCP